MSAQLPGNKTAHYIEVDRIDPNPRQPRRAFRHLDVLADSLRRNGLLEPIMVRPVGCRYQIIHGERRWRAARAAGWKEILATVRQATTAEAFEVALVENVQRAALTPVEEAGAYRDLQIAGMTQDEIGAPVGKSQSYVAHKLQLLRLPPPLPYYFQEGALTENHIRQLLTLARIYPADVMRQVCTEEHLIAIRQMTEQDQDALWIWIHAWRPEESPPNSVRDPLPAVVQQGTLAFADYVAQHNGAVPQWEVAAFWWASLAISHAVSVADLSHEIRMWRQRWEHAVTWWVILSRHGRPATCNHIVAPPERDPVPTSPAPKPVRLGSYEREQAQIWWGFWADLRHSGTLVWATELAAAEPEDQIMRFPRLEVVLREQREAGYLVPSVMQGRAAAHR